MVTGITLIDLEAARHIAFPKRLSLENAALRHPPHRVPFAAPAASQPMTPGEIHPGHTAVIARDTHLIIDSKSAMLVGFQPVDAAVEQLSMDSK